MKIYLPEDEYTILKYKFLEIVWQHNKPQNWFIIVTKYFEFSFEFLAKKYRKSWEFIIKFGYISSDKCLHMILGLFWWYFEIKLGKIPTYPFEKYITGEE